MIYIVCFSAPRFSLLYASFCVSMCFLLSCCVPLLYALMCLNVYFGASWCALPIRRWVHASWEPLYLPLASVQQQHIVSATSSNCRLLLGWHFHTTCSSSYLLIPRLFLLLILLLLPSHPYIWLLHCNALWVKVVGCPSQRICFGVFGVFFVVRHKNWEQVRVLNIIHSMSRTLPSNINL